MRPSSVTLPNFNTNRFNNMNWKSVEEGNDRYDTLETPFGTIYRDEEQGWYRLWLGDVRICGPHLISKRDVDTVVMGFLRDKLQELDAYILDVGERRAVSSRGTRRRIYVAGDVGEGAVIQVAVVHKFQQSNKACVCYENFVVTRVISDTLIGRHQERPDETITITTTELAEKTAIVYEICN